MLPAVRLRFVLTVMCACFVAGCGGGSSSPPATTTTVIPSGTTPAMSFYVYSDNDAFTPIQPSTVLQLAKTASGSVAPVSTITGPANVIFDALAEDGAGNLYVGGYTYNNDSTGRSGPGAINILEYSAGATGTATPLRNISGAGTGLQLAANNYISSLDVDGAGNLYVAAPVGVSGLEYQGISVFASSANGNAAPARVIAGTLTTMGLAPKQIAVTSTGVLYVHSSGVTPPDSVLVFGAAATGNVAPMATLGGSNTGLYTIRGLALDSAGNIYVMSLAKPTSTLANSAVPSILVFAAGSTGNVAPMRTISGSATTMIFGGQLRVDSAGNIYVVDQETILKFAPGASGNVAPVSTVSSSAFITPGSSVAVQ